MSEGINTTSIGRVNFIPKTLEVPEAKTCKPSDNIETIPFSSFAHHNIATNLLISDTLKKNDKSPLNSNFPVLFDIPVHEEFTYEPVKINDLSRFQKWTPGAKVDDSGVFANKIINNTYNNLDKQFNEYISNGDSKNGYVANWMSYGKFASREAGSQIQNLEGSMEALETIKEGAMSGDLSHVPKAVKALTDIMDTGPMTVQAIRMSATSMGVKNADHMNTAQLARAIIGKMELPVGISGLKDSAINKNISNINAVINNLNTLHTAMVKGNTEIYANVVPAFNIFLKAEASGGDGIKALKKAGYNGPTGGVFASDKSKDPQGFMIKAFTKYKEAKGLENKAEKLETQGKYQEAKKLREEKDQLIHQSNLLIGCQEQMCILQGPQIFGDPVVADLLKAMTGTMSIKDIPLKDGALRNNNLLSSNSENKDENWADFPTRMGLRQVDEIQNDVQAEKAGAIKISLPTKNGNIETHYFVCTNNNNGIPKGPNGTISQYFADNLNEKALLTTRPRDILPLYLSIDEKGKVDIIDNVANTVALGGSVAKLSIDQTSAAVDYSVKSTKKTIGQHIGKIGQGISNVVGKAYHSVIK